MWYALMMLALHPSIQDTLYSKIQQVLLGDRLPTYEDFQSFTYAFSIVYETLRLFPPVVGTPKVASHDCVLQGKYNIPRGTAVIFDIVNVHRDTKIWGADANEFNPSRFDNRTHNANNTENTPSSVGEKLRIPCKGAFLPFSEGQRSCLGTICGGYHVGG